MKRVLALLLTLALCVGLMPAALAAPATGVYFQLDSNGAPTGNCTPLTTRTISTSDGNRTFEAYWDLTYTLNQPFTFYYYDDNGAAGNTLSLTSSMANTDAQTLGGFNNVSFTPVGTDGKLWQVSFTPTLANEFNMQFRCQNSLGGGYEFLAFFQCNTPAEGIYFDAAAGEPVGTCFPATQDNNNDWGYWGLNYTSGAPYVFYLYAPSTASVSLNNVPSRAQVNMASAGSHLWEITVNAPPAFGPLQFDLNYGRGNIPVVLNDQYVAPYATGIYLSAANNAPAGTHLTAETRGGFGPDGQDTLSGYWDIPYTSGTTSTIYYYNPYISSLTVDYSGPVSINSRALAHGFWEVSLTAPQNFGDFMLNFRPDNGNDSFPVTFSDQYVDPYAEGIYFAAANNAPAGPVTKGSLHASGAPWGYWNIPYNSANGLTFYYYNSSAAFLALAGKPDGLAVQIDDAGDHFWKVTLTAPAAGFGNFEIAFNTASNDGFPISFTDQYQPTYTVGLYYKNLCDVEGGTPHVDPDEFYSNAPIVMAPYYERWDLAFYFYDGTDFTPVDVSFSNLTVDPVRVNGRTGWYMFAAYDFCDGSIYFRNGANTYSIDYSTCLPEYAFYNGTVPNQANFRMYTVAEKNTSTDPLFADYKYTKTLTFLPADLNRYFGLGPGSDVELAVSCFQRQYLPNGNETNEIAYNDFDYSWEAGNTSEGREYITLTLYTNDSDVLCHLDGRRPSSDGQGYDWLFGGYVNVLAMSSEDVPSNRTSLIFHANDQGSFASAKFLPQHLFSELAALNQGITISAENFTGSVTLDHAVVDTIAGTTTPVSFSMAAYDGAESADKAAVDALAGESTTALMTLEFGIDLPDGQLGGNATVTHMLDSSFVPAGSEVAVYYVADNGTATLVDTAAYENNTLTFTTNHFSSYVVVAKSAADSGGGNGGGNGGNAPAPSTPADPPAEEDPAETPAFSDVAEDYWAKSAIDFAAQKGYIAGNSDGSFAPTANISRQQIWMILSRVAGSEAENMASAKAWAVENGISDGSIPGASVTRQQLVTLLYRYALLMGMDVSVGEYTNILSYDDAADLAGYAVPAFQWACGAGIINGTTESTLSPLGTATRAQFAVMLQRFAESMAK